MSLVVSVGRLITSFSALVAEQIDSALPTGNTPGPHAETPGLTFRRFDPSFVTLA